MRTPLGRSRPRVNRLTVSDCEQGLKHGKAMLIRKVMATDPADRIENALSRIEAAAAAKSFALDRIQQRHTRLRARIEDAVTSLDTLIARESADEDD